MVTDQLQSELSPCWTAQPRQSRARLGHFRRWLSGVAVALVLLPSLSTAEEPVRSWKIGGRQEVRARFVRVHQGKVILNRAGRPFEVTPSRLSKADRDYVEGVLLARDLAKRGDGYRTWSDRQGNRVNAQFGQVHKGKVILAIDTKTKEFDFDNFSAADQEFIRRQIDDPATAGLPPASTARRDEQERTWTMSKGKQRTARFVRYSDQEVVLQEGEDIVAIAWNRISQSDRDYVRRQLVQQQEDALLPSARTAQGPRRPAQPSRSSKPVNKLLPAIEQPRDGPPSSGGDLLGRVERRRQYEADQERQRLGPSKRKRRRPSADDATAAPNTTPHDRPPSKKADSPADAPNQNQPAGSRWKRCPDCQEHYRGQACDKCDAAESGVSTGDILLYTTIFLGGSGLLFLVGWFWQRSAKPAPRPTGRGTVPMSDSDNWSFQTAQDGQMPIIIRVRNVPEYIQRYNYPQLIAVSWPYTPAHTQGMPDTDDIEQMDLLERLLTEALEKTGNAILTVVVTGNGVREWQWYSRNEKETMELVNAVLAEHKVFPVTFSSEADSKWEAYAGFEV